MTNWSPQQADALTQVARWHSQCMEAVAKGKTRAAETITIVTGG